mmetsp:Transcript_21236/g.23732  ORF Transcript_21236/g.23732 Transcript_21236/m.23732 type:complete len:207 (-) Transcript_21236:25-645(-)
MHKMEQNIAYLYSRQNKPANEKIYLDKAHQRCEAITRYLWNPEKKQWFDWFVGTAEKSNKVYPSNFFPLWSGCFNKAQSDELTNALIKSNLLQPGGVPASLVDSGQQWDSPNAWAPLQHIIVESLEALKTETSIQLAKELAQRWINSNYIAFKRDGYMHEKYNSKEPGKAGTGGEYTPQVGFGWTNGLALTFLKEYGSLLKCFVPQ